MALFTTTPVSEMIPTPENMIEIVEPLMLYPKNTPITLKNTDIMMINGIAKELN